MSDHPSTPSTWRIISGPDELDEDLVETPADENEDEVEWWGPGTLPHDDDEIPF